MIKNYKELFESMHHISESINSVEDISRMVYKGTDCGASCQTIDNGVMLGSIVEGVDGDGTQYHRLTFPFEYLTFWNKLDEVEKEAKGIWDATHDEDGNEIYDDNVFNDSEFFPDDIFNPGN